MIECDRCEKWVYMDNLNLNEEEKMKLKETNQEFICEKCLKNQVGTNFKQNERPQIKKKMN